MYVLDEGTKAIYYMYMNGLYVNGNKANSDILKTNSSLDIPSLHGEYQYVLTARNRWVSRHSAVRGSVW